MEGAINDIPTDNKPNIQGTHEYYTTPNAFDCKMEYEPYDGQMKLGIYADFQNKFCYYKTSSSNINRGRFEYLPQCASICFG